MKIASAHAFRIGFRRRGGSFAGIAGVGAIIAIPNGVCASPFGDKFPCAKKHLTKRSGSDVVSQFTNKHSSRSGMGRVDERDGLRNCISMRGCLITHWRRRCLICRSDSSLDRSRGRHHTALQWCDHPRIRAFESLSMPGNGPICNQNLLVCQCIL